MNARSKYKSGLYMLAGILLFSILIRVFVGQPCFIPSSSMENTIYEGDYVWMSKLSYGAILPKCFADIPLLNIFTWNKFLREADEKNDWGYHRMVGLKRPSIYDIAVFNSDSNPKVLIVKRIVGLPGDTVAIVNGNLQVNGRFLKQPPKVKRTKYDEPVSFPQNTLWTNHNYGPIVIPSARVKINLNKDNYSWVKWVAEREGYQILFDGNNFYCNGEKISCYQYKEDYYFVLGDNRKNSLDSRYNGFVSESNLEGTINYILFSVDREAFLGFSFRIGRLIKKIQ